MPFCESLFCKLDIDVSFAATSNTVKQNRIGSISIYFFDSAFLSGIERISRGFLDVISRRLFRGAALFCDASRQNGLDNGGEGTAIIVTNPEESFDEMFR